MHPPESAKELYEELADRMRAQDDAGARRVFHELQKTGRSRQEIVAEVSRLMEGRSADKPLGRNAGESPWLGHQKPSTWSHTPINGPQHRFDRPAAETTEEPEIPRTDADTGQRAAAPNEHRSGAVSGVRQRPLTNQNTVTHTEHAPDSHGLRQGASLENLAPAQIGADLSVTERAASKLNLRAVLSAGKAEPSSPTEAVAAEDQQRPAQRASRAMARSFGIFLTGTSIMAVALAGLLVLWSLYGSQVQEFVSARAPSALTWWQKFGNNVSFNPDADKPQQSTGPTRAQAVSQGNPMPQGAEANSAQPPADRSIRNPKAAVAEPVVADERAARTEPNTGATLTPPNAQIPKELSSQTAAPSSQLAEPVTVPTAAPSRSQQNESDAAQAHQTVGPQVLPIDTGALLVQGDQLLAKSDFASARLLYHRVAEAGDGRGALRMGMTFDPLFLARWRLRGVRANRAQAIAWYRHASALGNADAELRRRSLVTYAVRRRRYY